MSATLTITDELETSNEELVTLAREGDTSAFGELVQRFERMVYAVCWQRLRDHSEALDVSQDVFIKAFEKLHQLKEPAAVAGWVSRIS